MAAPSVNSPKAAALEDAKKRAEAASSNDKSVDGDGSLAQRRDSRGGKVGRIPLSPTRDADKEDEIAID